MSAPKRKESSRTIAVNSPPQMFDRLYTGHAAEVMTTFPEGSVDLIITSPPYWNAVEYDQGENPWPSYEAYLEDRQAVWSQCARVLRPNGKLCINSPIMPIPKAMIEQHTRHLKNIAFDMEHKILAETDLERYSLFVWQKQTSKMMFGSYPYPGNIIENNTIEFINVYVKPGTKLQYAAKVVPLGVIQLRTFEIKGEIGKADWIDISAR